MYPICFKALSIATNEWLYGEVHLKNCRSPHIHTGFCKPVNIIPESVCQFTGFTDKDDTEIYDCDIVDNIYFFGRPKLIRWHNGGWVIVSDFMDKYDATFHVPLYLNTKNLKVIGNYHSSPELLNHKPVNK